MNDHDIKTNTMFSYIIIHVFLNQALLFYCCIRLSRLNDWGQNDFKNQTALHEICFLAQNHKFQPPLKERYNLHTSSNLWPHIRSGKLPKSEELLWRILLPGGSRRHVTRLCVSERVFYVLRVSWLYQRLLSGLHGLLPLCGESVGLHSMEAVEGPPCHHDYISHVSCHSHRLSNGY